MRVCVHVCAHACVHAHVCMRACVCVHVRAWLRALRAGGASELCSQAELSEHPSLPHVVVELLPKLHLEHCFLLQ